jgi:hypothetical protein
LLGKHHQRAPARLIEDALAVSRDHLVNGCRCNRLARSWAFFAAPQCQDLSLGDLIRQIRYYQGFLPSLHGFVVVSPDTRLRAQIETQHIGFYEY